MHDGARVFGANQLQVADVLTSFAVEAHPMSRVGAINSREPVASSANSKYVMLVSGLQIGNATHASSYSEGPRPSELSAQLLIDFVAGRLHEHAEVDMASKIVRWAALLRHHC